MNWQDKEFHEQAHKPAQMLPPWQRPGKGHRPQREPRAPQTLFGVIVSAALLAAIICCVAQGVPAIT